MNRVLVKHGVNASAAVPRRCYPVDMSAHLSGPNTFTTSVPGALHRDEVLVLGYFCEY